MMSIIIKSIRNTENWYDLFLLRIGLKKQVKLRYRSGLSKTLEKEDISLHKKIVSLGLKNENIVFLDNDKMCFDIGGFFFELPLNIHGFRFYEYGIKLLSLGCNLLSKERIALPNNVIFEYPKGDKSCFCHIYETFFKETYSLLNVRNQTVLDIGASFGDTSVYFALKGAKKVYSYEPLKEVFPYLMRNIVINELNDKIVPLNMAVSSKKERKYMNPLKEWYGKSFTSKNESGLGYWVNAGPTIDADVMKMDCEGCEYDVFLNTAPLSLKYDEIMIEFHRGKEKIIDVLLYNGYEVRVINETRYGKKKHGMVYAKKL